MVATALVDNGIPAKRTPLSGAIGGNYGEDVIIGTRGRREQISDVSHEFRKKELAEWMRRIKANNIPALPDIAPFYAHKTPGTKQVLLQLVGKGKRIAASFAAPGFHLSVWKNWLKEDPDFELALIQAVSKIPGRGNCAHTRLASWALAT